MVFGFPGFRLLKFDGRAMVEPGFADIARS